MTLTATTTTTTSAPAGTSDGALTAAVRSEWIKLTTLRSTVALVATTAISGLAVAWAVALFVTDEVLLASAVATYSTVLTALLASIGGILAVTAEVQHGTLPAAFAAHPTRWPIIGAKTIVAAALGVILGATGLVAGFVGAVIGGLDVGPASAIGTNIVGALVFTTCSAVLGLGRDGGAAQHRRCLRAARLVAGAREPAAGVPPGACGPTPPLRRRRRLARHRVELGVRIPHARRERRRARPYTAIALGIGAVVLRRRDVH